MRSSVWTLTETAERLVILCVVGLLMGCAEEEKAEDGGGVATVADPADAALTEEDKALLDTADPAAIAAADDVPDNRIAIRSRVRTRRSALPTLESVIEHGTRVEKGDQLARFDSSGVEEEIAAVTAQSHVARADVIKAEAMVSLAQLALREFTEGTYPLDEDRIKLEITDAELHLAQAEKAGNHVGMDRAKAHLSFAKRRLQVLQSFTKVRRTAELEANIEVAKADLAARSENFQLMKVGRDRLMNQLEECIIRAPQAGRVWLADENGGRPGARFRQNQVLMYLDPEE